ncbi:hypothetical protein ONZ45_g7373 [Pleurotus djamor]|nr:hypothetical protein ONZ45_g7373 [Pleurotus djamor]
MVAVPPASASSQDFTLPAIPELYLSNFLDVLIPPAPTTPSSKDRYAAGLTAWGTPLVQTRSNPMISALTDTANRTWTTNGAGAFSFTGSATLDAFQFASERTGRELDKVLSRSWREDPELTIRIIWNLRSIHDGKGDKEGFYRAFGWLYQKHPRTAIANLHLLVEPVCSTPRRPESFSHGYWKDLLNILALETTGELAAFDGSPALLHHPRQKYTYPRQKRRLKIVSRDTRILLAQKANENRRVAAKALRAKKASQSAQRLGQKLRSANYRALFVAVARLFAQQLVKDIKLLGEADELPEDADRVAFLKGLSLAGKWAPTPGLFHDRVTNISTAIALLIRHSKVLPFPAILDDAQADLCSRDRFAILRSFYQRWVLTPLRRASVVTETFMASNRWNEIRYNRVASHCMQLHKDHFHKHDEDRFSQYLVRLIEGKATISGATLMPHELVAQVTRATMAQSVVKDKVAAVRQHKIELMRMQSLVAEEQWKALINRLRESGSIDNAIAICDVSGSMGSIHCKLDKNAVQPIFPAVALSLVLSQLAKPPFNNGFITFSSTPQFVTLDPTLSLSDSIQKMVRADWGDNTDFDAVFLKLLLPLAIERKVKQEDMIKRLFVFSDMQFDASHTCSGSTTDWWTDSAGGDWGAYDAALRAPDWKTNHDTIEEAYKAAGYEVPQIVYWNLASHQSVPVTAEKKGVALLNGFSPAMLKIFMGEEPGPEEDKIDGEWQDVEEDGETKTLDVDWNRFDPVNAMKKALSQPSYRRLTVAYESKPFVQG